MNVNSQTALNYTKFIVDKFGGEMKEELMTDLLKLITIATKKEGETTCRDEINSLQGYIKDTPENTVKFIVSSNKPDYDKVLLIISALKILAGTYHISIIPGDLFNIFWTFAENTKYGINFEDDYQHFHFF